MTSFELQENISLKPFNTLSIDASARYFLTVKAAEEIPRAYAFARENNLPVLVIGGGSNIVLTKNFPGLVLKMALRGIDCLARTDGSVQVTAAAGENWHELVQFCLQNNYYGLENLSLIPGCVGAAPIQNIGAYGVELVQVFESLNGWNCKTQQWQVLSAEECKFGYRESVFKHELKHQFVITSVTLKLSTRENLNTQYDALKKSLDEYKNEHGSDSVTAQIVAQTVMAIRRSKLPDPEQLPNAGSFFKNPVLSADAFGQFHSKFPDAVFYSQSDNGVKIAAGWLLEKAGWKGKIIGAAGMHAAQALVLINYQDATGEQVLALARSIQKDIKQRFLIDLEIEPSLY